MIQEFDSRDDVDRTSEERVETLQERAEEVSDALPGDQRISVVSFDRATGNAAVVVSHRGEQGGEDFVRRALDHVQRIGPALGLAAEQPPEFQADPLVQRTSAGGAAVHLRQQYKGIAIYEASATVRFDPNGRLTEVAGRNHTVDADLPVRPAVSAEAALRLAAQAIDAAQDTTAVDPFGQPLGTDLDLSDFQPVPIAMQAETPDQSQTFEASPFVGSANVRLIWFPRDDGLRLGWHTVLQVPHGPEFRVIIDAADATLLLLRQLARAIVGSADVFLDGGGGPRTREPLPVPVTRYGVTVPDDLPAGTPGDWLTDASTAGANVIATLATTGFPAEASHQAGDVVFAPGDPAGDDQLVVNLFAFCGVMHDVFYALGFREADGNFQLDNQSRGGVGSDRVTALVHPGTVWGTANMSTPPDGHSPTMNMGLVASTERHTALDPDVVFHEYSHGLSNRLVGGPLDSTALDAPQSGGMGEGWGDYFACVLMQRETVGSWVVDRPGGIRAFPYDEHYPDTFAELGSGRYTQVHAIGELWCATLMELGRRIGTGLSMQLVVDAMKLSASNPGFLAIRDAILVAARDHATAAGMGVNDTDDLIAGIWSAFARFGMGPGASSVEATLGPVVADFTAPPRTTGGPAISRTVTPSLPIPDNDPRGIASSMSFDAGGVVTTASLAVTITHTYRGDLVVQLRPPNGDTIVLHDRQGGGADGLVATYDTAANGPLGAVVGVPLAGTWTLEVIDRARRDVGTLDAWTFEAVVAEQRPSATATATPGLVIPDDTPDGVTSSLELTGDAAVRKLVVDLDLTHTYVGDLMVELSGPTGARAVLHDRDGGSTDNLIRSYDSEGGTLSTFVGLPVAGTWTLRVSDHAGQDVGKLNRWSVHADL